MSIETNETVAGWFEASDEDLKGAEILFADYECGGYEGSAFVLFRRDGKLWEVNGSHCSCYGLEGQWSPEETSVEALEHRLYKGSGFYTDDIEGIREVLVGLKG